MSLYSIAIDGPAGAGKSTMAKALAQELGFLYVDTGAIYRTLGVAVFQRGIDPSDAASVIEILPDVQIELRYGGDGLQHMYLDGVDVTTEIRRHLMSDYASKVSAIPEVRSFLLEMQRALARNNNVIMDGRDIGTVVLPNASLKIYLTADADDRAMRRFKELQERGQSANYDTVLQDVLQRDKNDSEREVAPLRQAEDAVLVDTTGIGRDESYTVLLSTVKERLSL